MDNTDNLPEHIRQAFAKGGTVTHGGQYFETAEGLLAAYPDIATAHEAKPESVNLAELNQWAYGEKNAQIYELTAKIAELEALHSPIEESDTEEYKTLLEAENTELKAEVEKLKSELAATKEEARQVARHNEAANLDTTKPKPGK